MTRPAMLVVGESLIDIVERAGEEPVEHVGGSPANVAVGLARLGHDVELATWFGTDERGARVREHLERDGVVVVPGSDGAERTSTARARLDEHGAADYVFDLTCDLPPLTVQVPPLVHVGSVSAVLEPAATKTARLLDDVSATATVTYDPNARPAIMGDPAEARARVEALVARADVVKVSDEDVAWLAPGEDAGAVARAWLALGPAVVVVTRGESGAEAYARGVRVSVPAATTTVVDTVGAGDSFMAGVIDGLARAGLVGAEHRPGLRAMDGDTLRGILERASAVAAVTVSRAGANPPTAAELPTPPAK